MIRLYKYIRGYVKIRISGFSPERFMNLCCNRGILIWKVVRCTDDYEMFMYVNDFFKVAPLLRKTGTKAVVLERYGLPFFVHRYQKRKLFPIGILFCFLFLFSMSLFIWEIRIEGNLYRTDDMITDYLKELQIHPGLFKSRIDCEAIEKGLRQEFDDITWTSAKIEGTCLEIRIKENEMLSVNTKVQEIPCDLIAEEDGIIMKIVTRSGVPWCTEGMIVTKGSVLVSGAIPIRNDSSEIIDYHYVKADADIRTKTKLRYKDAFPLRTFRKIYTGKERRCFNLFTEKQSIQLLSVFPKYTNYDFYMAQKQISIFKDFCLPVSVGQGYEREYYEAGKVYQQQEAAAIAKKRLQKYCDDLIEKGVQIIANSVKIEFVNHICTSSGEIIVIQDAGKEHSISIHTEDTQ